MKAVDFLFISSRLSPKPPVLKAGKIGHIVLVLVVFTLTGFSAARLSSLLGHWLGIVRFSSEWWLINGPFLLFIYQFLLLGFAAIFGKYQYFRDKQVRLWRKITSLFSGSGN